MPLSHADCSALFNSLETVINALKEKHLAHQQFHLVLGTLSTVAVVLDAINNTPLSQETEIARSSFQKSFEPVLSGPILKNPLLPALSAYQKSTRDQIKQILSSVSAFSPDWRSAINDLRKKIHEPKADISPDSWEKVPHFNSANDASRKVLIRALWDYHQDLQKHTVKSNTKRRWHDMASSVG